MARQFCSAIALPIPGFSHTLSSLLIATYFQLGQLPDISLKGVTYILTLSGHVSLHAASDYGQECRPVVFTSLSQGT